MHLNTEYVTNGVRLPSSESPLACLGIDRHADVEVVENHVDLGVENFAQADGETLALRHVLTGNLRAGFLLKMRNLPR